MLTLEAFFLFSQAAEADTQGDIWYNISHLAIGIGDLGLAYQVSLSNLSCWYLI